MTIDIEDARKQGWFWRPFSFGGVLTRGNVEVWLPDGIVKVWNREVCKITTDEELLAIAEALKLP